MIGFSATDTGYLLYPRDVISNRNSESPTITFYSAGSNNVNVELTSLTSTDTPRSATNAVTVS